MSSFQPWVLDPHRHPPKASILTRGCTDIVASYLATLLYIGTAGFSVYAYLFANNATVFPLVMMALSAIMAIELRAFGEVSLRHNWPILTYVHLVIYYTLVFSLLWMSALNWIFVKQALEYIEENWYLLQATVFIPFTTLIDQKVLVKNSCWGVFWFGLITALVSLGPLFDAWRALGGTVRMVQSKLGILIPEFIVLLIASVATLAFDDVAATVAAFATPHSTSALLWQSACAGITLMAIISLFVASSVWGSSVVTHATAALIYLPCGFILMITSSVTLTRSGEIEGFVSANWETLKLFVPPQYSHLSWEKYAMASYTPMAAAGATGILLALLLIFSFALRVRCVHILGSIGPELYALQRGKAIPGTEQPEGHSLLAGYGAIGSDAPTSGAGALPTSYNGVDAMTTVSFDHGVKDHTIAEPKNTFGLDQRSFAEAKHAATVAFAKYLAAHNIPQLGVHKEWPEEQLATKVKPMPPKVFCKSLCSGWGDAWRSNKICVIPTVVALVVLLIGMTVSLVQLEKEGKCGILGREPASVTYNTTFNIEFQHAVHISSNFPFGSVEVIANHYASGTNHQARLEVTYFAPVGVSMPSLDDFLASVFLSDYGQETDDDTGGYFNTTIVLSAPAGAATDCVAARLRFYAGSSTEISYTLSSSNAMVNVTGNALDLNLGITSTLLASLSINTDTAPVVISNAWMESSVLLPGDPNDPNFTVTPMCNITSNTGDVSINFLSSPGVVVRTSGTIRASNAISAGVLKCMGACGDMDLQTTGSGRIAISQAFGGNNAYIKTDSGVIVGANTGVIIGRKLEFISNTGKVYLVNFLQALGNETLITTSNDVSISAMTANRVTVNAGDGAKVSVVEVFLGYEPSALVKPPILNGTYGLPLLDITTSRGDIGILGAGGAPGSEIFAGLLSVNLRSDIGDIKIEVNGGGYSGNYTVGSGRGSTIVEIDGLSSPNKGYIGDPPGTGVNEMMLYSNGGDVQLSVLASPL